MVRYYIASTDAQIGNNSDAGAFKSFYRTTALKVSIFRRMEDTDLEDDQFYRLYQLMNSWDEEEFKTLLQLVPLDLVTTLNDPAVKRGDLDLSFFLQLNTKSARDHGTLLQDAVYDGKSDFVRILLEYGFVCTLIISFRSS